jgi:hypothetical protein
MPQVVLEGVRELRKLRLSQVAVGGSRETTGKTRRLCKTDKEYSTFVEDFQIGF